VVSITLRDAERGQRRDRPNDVAQELSPTGLELIADEWIAQAQGDEAV
jgi:hypothetical protein